MSDATEPSASQAILRLNDIHKGYGLGAQEAHVLRSISLTVRRGELCAITGPSGCGKSTLLNIIGLLDRPTSGRVFLRNAPTDTFSAMEAAKARNQIFGFVFQSHQLLTRYTAWENVALPLFYRGIPDADRRARAIAVLEQVGLEQFVHHRPLQLSGGQQQRVAIARALVGSPELILADEPTGSLDTVSSSEVFELICDLNRSSGVTVIMVTHDRELAARCDRQIEMLDGRIAGDRGGI